MAATESSTRAAAALDDLYRRHVGDVYRYTYAVLGNHADAEDVTQTTFVNALRALERGETPRNASHWLLAISHNLVRQRWRQAAARPTVVELVHDVPDEPEEADDVELDELVRALQRIPPSQREALVMRELEGRPYAEIAGLLGITTSALETLLFRARRSLAEELENLVTCQNAELSISKSLDGRLSRKERKRLDEHLSECEDCARLAAAAKRQRRAFKGLALLPLPVGLALFKGAPAASAATVTTIGVAGSGAGATGVGAAGAGGVAAGGAVAGGSAVAGGGLLGGAAVKIAAAVVAATVATGVGYEGVKAVRDGGKTPAAGTAPTSKGSPPATKPVAVSGATARTAGKARTTSVTPVKARGKAGAPGQLKRSDAIVAKTAGKSEAAKARAAAKKAAHVPHSPKAGTGKDAAKAKAPPAKTKTPPANGKTGATPTVPKGPKAGTDATPAPKPEKPKQNPDAGRAPSKSDAQPPEAPAAAPPAAVAPGSGSAGAGQGQAGGSGGTAAPTAPSSEPAVSSPPTTSPVEGGAASSSGCPGGGSGPGNGPGCGYANGHDKHR
jgi:RNA polymerase sigma factor (sigma-70 family)